MVNDHLQSRFPRLKESAYCVTSPQSVFYNCIAWAAGDTNRPWWPDALFQYYWPKDAPREVNLEAFCAAFSPLGYRPCETGEPEEGFEKVAIYNSPDGKPTHMARQLRLGVWTSKLGDLEDIEHSLEGLEGSAYGSVAFFLKRARR